MTDQKTYMFEEMPVPQAVAKQAVPTVVSSVVMILYNLADTYFVGMLNDPIQSAAVTLVAPVILLFNAVSNLFGLGAASYMSRSLGKKDYKAVSETSAFGIYGGLISAVFFALLCALFRSPLLNVLGADALSRDATLRYLRWTVYFGAVPSILSIVLSSMIRSEGASLQASAGMIGGCVLNIILDPFFILPFGLNMGAAGAGLATMLSNTCACLYLLGCILSKLRHGDTYISLDVRHVSFDREIIREVLTVGVPISVQNILNVTGATLLNNITSGYGTDAVAAMGIAHKVNTVPLYVSMGLGQGIMPLVGYNYAAGNGKRLKKIIRFATALTAGFILLTAGAMYLGSYGIIEAFMKNDAVVAIGGRLLRAFCLGLPFLAFDFLFIGCFQAVGMGKESLIFAILRKLVLEIPAIVLLDRLAPLYGLPYSQLVAELVLASVEGIVMLRLFKKVENTEKIKEV